MKISDKLDRYLNDKELKVTYLNRTCNVNNYKQIIDFNNQKVVIQGPNQIITIEGMSLVVTKMVDNEVLVTGEITGIKFEYS